MTKKQKTIGDNMDWLSMGLGSTFVAALMPHSLRKLREEKRAVFAIISEFDITDDFRSLLNPVLAQLRTDIIAAYDKKTASIDQDKVSKALDKINATLAPTLEKETKALPFEKQMEIGTVFMKIIALEAAMALKEPVPAKGQSLG